MRFDDEEVTFERYGDEGRDNDEYGDEFVDEVDEVDVEENVGDSGSEIVASGQRSPENGHIALEQNFVPEEGKKYFTVTIGYPAMRQALRDRGWVEVKALKRI